MDYKEDWELSTIQTKNAANEIRLNDEYQYVYLCPVSTRVVTSVNSCYYTIIMISTSYATRISIPSTSHVLCVGDNSGAVYR